MHRVNKREVTLQSVTLLALSQLCCVTLGNDRPAEGLSGTSRCHCETCDSQACLKMDSTTPPVSDLYVTCSPCLTTCGCELSCRSRYQRKLALQQEPQGSRPGWVLASKVNSLIRVTSYAKQRLCLDWFGRDGHLESRWTSEWQTSPSETVT